MTQTYTDERLTELESMLSELEHYITPTPERTIFSIGGRGYYENPTSDLLSFFMNPTAEHGFGMLFLSVFLERLDKAPDLGGLRSEEITVQREVVTDNNNRIDLLITAPDWCLVIENKIYHDPVNPFADYEKHARNLRPNDSYFAILSPKGHGKKSWPGVSYKDYLEVLRQKIGEHSFEAPYSKWNLIAREFILHIENELYRPLMNDEQIAFVENNFDQIDKVKKLESDYRTYLKDFLKKAMEAEYPEQQFEVKDANWAFRCSTPLWGASDLALWREDDRFMITVYLQRLDESQKEQAKSFFSGMKHGSESGGWLSWYDEDGSISKEDAVAELCRLASKVNDIFGIRAGTDTPSTNN